MTTIEPVTLDDGTYSPSYVDGKRLWAAGMGLSNTVTETFPIRLQEIELEYVSDDVCRQEENNTLILPTGAATLCSRHPGGEGGGICSGDSGGPLYDKENQALVGISSYSSLQCGDALSDVFGRVSDKFSWIKSIICSRESQSASLCNQTAKPTTSPAPTMQWCNEASVEISINPDLFPSENAFYIKDLHSNEILAANVLESFAPDVTHKGKLCLPVSNKECYAFGIIDSYGDGIDVGGTDHDYCIKVNNQVIYCNTDFTGSLETVVFPEESCMQSCVPSKLNLEMMTRTSTSSVVKLTIQDTRGNDIFPYILEVPSDIESLSVPVNLCRGCYQISLRNYKDVRFDLVEEATNDVVVSSSQFSKSSVVTFSVGKMEGCDTNGAPPRITLGWLLSFIFLYFLSTVFLTFGLF